MIGISKVFVCIILMILSVVSLFGRSTDVIQLGNDTKEVYVVRNYVEYLEDSSGIKKPREVFKLGAFKCVEENLDDFTNREKLHTYWIRFSIVNLNSDNQYRLEMFDHDIDEVSLFYWKKDSLMESHSGYSKEFKQRDLYHKNVGFLLSLPPGDTLIYLMRFKSDKMNILEPVIRSLPAFYRYSLIEYTLLGFFYGLTCLIILYNLVAFIILRSKESLYYLLYMTSITIYLMSRNGTGFQFLWPDTPGLNKVIETLSSSVGVNFLLLFTNTFLLLNRRNKKVSKFLMWLMLVNLISIPFQIVYQMNLGNVILSTLFLQVVFVISLMYFKNVRKKGVWFLIGFFFLNSGLVISWLEYLDVISSSIFTVYVPYLAINLQFICISIGMIQGIRELHDEKKRVLSELLNIADKNQMMRILALKKQMNPHFIFNALNSILQRILSGNKNDASEYLIKFSKLIRKTLEHSDTLYCSLSDELESLKLYLSLEAMRLGNNFNYSIEVANHVNIEQELIPSFIIQPFVENSIWHGLMPKPGEKKLWIRIEKKEAVLMIFIEDNGIGRKQSEKLKKQHGSKSQGIGLITERMELLNKMYKVNSCIEVEDLYGPENETTGTKVIITTNFTNEQDQDYHNRRRVGRSVNPDLFAN